MIAATIMALAITTSLIVLQRAFVALDFARKVTLAGQVMQSEFEKMRLTAWADIDKYGTEENLTASIGSAFDASAAITNSFTLVRRVDPHGVHPNMKQITLTISWRAHDGRAISRSYTTYYGKDGLYDYFYNSY